jgi:phosphoglycolate phosphatase
MRRPPPVIFDLDGTLIDSVPSLHRAVAALMTERDLPVPDLPTVTGFVGEGAAVLTARCLDWAGAAPDPAAPDRFVALYAVDPVTGTRVYPGAHDLLTGLAARGHALGLCTNKPEGPARDILAAFDLGPFAALAGADTLAVRKPDPAPLLYVAAALGAAPGQAIFVGDSRTDWRTAAAAGLRYVHVEGGYERDVPPPGSVWRRCTELSAVAGVLPRETCIGRP